MGSIFLIRFNPKINEHSLKEICMSQHADLTRSESAGTWLPITEYAVRTGVSLSTIRRKIKTNTIRFKLERGKYMLFLDFGMNSDHRMPLESADDLNEDIVIPSNETPSILDRTLKMVSTAFEQSLKEKDERIQLLEKRCRDLEERIVEQKTLIRVFEEKFKVRY